MRKGTVEETGKWKENNKKKRKRFKVRENGKEKRKRK